MKTPAIILLNCSLLCSHWLGAQTLGEGGVEKALVSAQDKQPQNTQTQKSEDFIEEMRNLHFKNIDELVALQVPGLALSYIKREQPAYQPEQPIEWLFWEQKRIELLAYTRQWLALIERVDTQREKLNTVKVATADRNWFLTE